MQNRSQLLRKALKSIQKDKHQPKPEVAIYAPRIDLPTQTIRQLLTPQPKPQSSSSTYQVGEQLMMEIKSFS